MKRSVESRLEYGRHAVRYASKIRSQTCGLRKTLQNRFSTERKSLRD
ncbi:MAG: hypothetical protein LBR52_00060 [Prevotellaceae bacterium]|jgi:hypothetical protein|nr:hypothetical protein [Prevotellaceae bacterium]